MIDIIEEKQQTNDDADALALAARWMERAIAAEKTVAILKDKVHSLYNGESRTTVQKQIEKAARRQDEARRRREVSDVRSAELARYNQTLADEVKERTRDIRTILDHVTSGFLIIGPDLIVRPGFTSSCHLLLEAEAIVGSHLAELLRVSTKKDVEHLTHVIEQVFSDQLPEELTLDFIPRRFPINDRVISLETRVIRSEGDGCQVTGLLMTINDITSLEHAQQQVVANELLIGILSHRAAFRSFIVDSRSLFHASYDATQPFVRRAIHTVKGNAAAFGLSTIVATLHQIESAETIGTAEIARAEEAIRSYLAANQSVLEMTYDVLAESYEVSAASLEELRSVADSPVEIARWTSKLVLRRADLVFSSFGHYVERLSQRLEKEIAFTMNGGDTMIDGGYLRPMVTSITHAIRNSIDHGIEMGDDRGDKSPVGSIDITIVEEDEEWQIAIRDDGRGIDCDRLAELAVERGFVKAEDISKMSPQSKLALVFVDGLSTTDREGVSDISGRGVGMSALKNSVDELGGTITIESTKHVGTKISIQVPKPAPISSVGQRRAA